MNTEGLTTPTIYLFHNSTSDGMYCGCAIAEDGAVLGHHASSSEDWMIHDLNGKTAQFEAHYPAGYQLEYVARAAVPTHKGIQEAFRLDDERHAAVEEAAE